MKRLRRGAGTLTLAVVALAVIGVSAATSRGDPIDLSIAKEKSGPYKAAGLFTDQPATSPQVQKQKIKPGKTAKFYVRMKNTNADSIGDYIGGDQGTSDFDVRYSLQGEDVTDDLTPDCTFMEVPANGKLTFQMKVKATGAAPGDSDFFAAYLGNGTSCTPLDDLVWASVKVK